MPSSASSDTVIYDLSSGCLIAQAVLSWLVAFGIVNRYNRVVATVGDFLWRITEPALRPIRRILPDLGGDRHFAGDPDPAVVFSTQPDVRIPCLTGRSPRRMTGCASAIRLSPRAKVGPSSRRRRRPRPALIKVRSPHPPRMAAPTKPCCGSSRARGIFRAEISRSIPARQSRQGGAHSRRLASTGRQARRRNGWPAGRVRRHMMAGWFRSSSPGSPSAAAMSCPVEHRVARLVRDQLGERGFLALYSLRRGATFAWFVVAYRLPRRSGSGRAAMDGARPGRP